MGGSNQILVLTIINSILSILFTQDVEAQKLNDKSRYIVYDDTIMLKWSDFKAKPEDEAHIATSFRFDDYYLDQKKEFIVEVSAFMDMYKSCPFEEPSADSLFCLEHELTHFKISEVCARYCRKEIQCIKKRREKAIHRKVQEIVLNYGDIMLKLQDQYDQETNHSLLVTKQRKWNDLVNKWLNDLSEFSSTKVVLHLK